MSDVFIGNSRYQKIIKNSNVYYIRAKSYFNRYSERNTNKELTDASEFIFEIVPTNNNTVHEQLLRKSPNKI